VALINCPECQREVSDRALACPHCGNPFTAAAARSPAPPPPAYSPQTVVQLGKSRSFAVLLAIVLGGLGAHKFYLNRPGWGVVYLLFCWTFIPSILGLIEGLLYLGMSEDSFRFKYGPA